MASDVSPESGPPGAASPGPFAGLLLQKGLCPICHAVVGSTLNFVGFIFRCHCVIPTSFGHCREVLFNAYRVLRIMSAVLALENRHTVLRLPESSGARSSSIKSPFFMPNSCSTVASARASSATMVTSAACISRVSTFTQRRSTSIESPWVRGIQNVPDRLQR